VNFLVKLNQELQQRIKYLIRMEPACRRRTRRWRTRRAPAATPAGSVQTLRHLGFAARFVSGYLLQLRPDMKALEGPTGPEADFTDLHAWAEVYLPGAGWVGLDPTSGLLVSEGHIPLCASPEPQSAAPISGNVDPSGVKFSHEMRVARLIEAPRVTRPYTDEQWLQIDALGRAVEERLTRGDVRLTMGGEPTFISLDDMQGAEWNTAALGTRKLELSAALIERLRARFAPHGLLTWGQGKWYPGESLPRWVYTLYWRGDGKPLWQTIAPKNRKPRASSWRSVSSPSSRSASG